MQVTLNRFQLSDKLQASTQSVRAPRTQLDARWSKVDLNLFNEFRYNQHVADSEDWP